MQIRNAEFEDMGRLAAIMVQSFRSAFSGFVSKETMDACANEENCRAMLEELCRQGQLRFLMGEDSGFLCWQEEADGVQLMALHSLPRSWGSGLGHALLTHALEQIGDRTVTLWAFEQNTRARRFYEKHGFRWDGARRISEFDGAPEVRYVRTPPAR